MAASKIVSLSLSPQSPDLCSRIDPHPLGAPSGFPPAPAWPRGACFPGPGGATMGCPSWGWGPKWGRGDAGPSERLRLRRTGNQPGLGLGVRGFPPARPPGPRVPQATPLWTARASAWPFQSGGPRATSRGLAALAGCLAGCSRWARADIGSRCWKGRVPGWADVCPPTLSGGLACHTEGRLWGWLRGELLFLFVNIPLRTISVLL